ncbi:MAG: phage minor capsid protein [Eubacteriales bacterium]|nr:phage minor capsid protein [Eubacteriales bacterium]
MTQGELEKIPLPFQKAMSELELRIMTDIVRRIKANGFSTATADWQITRLQQLGDSEKEIKQWIKEALQVTDQDIDRIFDDEAYKEYYGHERAYKINGMEQIPFEQNQILQHVIEAARQQTRDTFRNLTGSMGFALKDPATGALTYSPLMEFYRDTLDAAMLDIHSGAFDYQTVLKRTIQTMTNSGLRWIDYDSGWHNRVDVAARRAVMTGFRQVQGEINEQVAAELHTDTYEVSYHVGARPTHQPWQGCVWTMQELIDVCGLGTVTGLHGANCYHDYRAFPPGSIRTYTDEQLDQMLAKENAPKEYNGKQYTTYEALQQQRKMETAMRATRQQIKLLQEGGADAQEIMLKKAKYQGQMQSYKDFSSKMGLPEQVKRVYQDGLGQIKTGKTVAKPHNIDIMKSGAVSGARNPYGEAADEHAKRYYGLVRKMRTDVRRISETTGIPESDIQAIKDYLFVKEHDLGTQGVRRFDPDYMIGESWRRLIDGKPEPHDLTLLNHEIEEKGLIAEGMSQDEAHIKATSKYNYAKEAAEYYGKIKKYKKE